VFPLQKQGIRWSRGPAVIEDRVLIWRFNAGDVEALCRVYEKYRRDLLAVARAVLTDAAAAEDVLHDVFVQFASRAGRFEPRGSLKGYLAVCVANRARNVNRQRRPARSEGLAEATARPSGQASSLDALAGAERAQLVAAAMADLPQEQREVIALHVLGGLRFRQIALQTGESINTIQSRYRYGMQRLRSLLDGQVEP
jgi:RNA polymerase sigma-70 factor, ECF subfamily